MNNSKKKILIFLHKSPYPDQDSTKYRIFNSIILPLKDYFDIEILVITYEKISEKELDYLRSVAPVDFYFYPKWKFILNTLFKCFSWRPFQTEMFFYKKVFDKFLKKSKNADCIYVHTVRLGKYIEKLPSELKQKVLLDYNDSISMHYLKGWKLYPLFLKLPILFEGIKLYFYEKKLFKIFNNFAIVSPIDKNFILKNINGKKEIFRNKNFIVTYTTAKTHQLNSNKRKINTSNQPYISFMGNLEYYPNREGILHFLKDIWPKIKNNFKELEFLIIGKIDSKFKNKFKNVKGVKFLGFIEEPSHIIKNSLAFISPVRIGAGMQGKVIEIMGMKQVVITYPQGIEGINGLKDRENLLICKRFEWREWYKLIKEVLTNPTLVEYIKKNGQKLVLDEFSSKRVFERYLEIFTKIL